MGRTAAGRMINQDIAFSGNVAALSPESLALFCLLIPHYSSHGKMLANPHVIKGNVCPLIEWLPVGKIESCLAEISAKTNVKWWRDERGLHYLHSLTWKDHQTLREDRLGPDHLPDYPGDKRATPGILPEYSRTCPAKGKGREGKKEGKAKGEEAFLSFWKEYPKKIGKGAAERAWKNIKSPKETLPLILSALDWQKESHDWAKENGKYIPNPATYLNQRRWEDEKTEIATPAGTWRDAY